MIDLAPYILDGLRDSFWPFLNDRQRDALARVAAEQPAADALNLLLGQIEALTTWPMGKANAALLGAARQRVAPAPVGQPQQQRRAA